MMNTLLKHKTKNKINITYNCSEINDTQCNIHNTSETCLYEEQNDLKDIFINSKHVNDYKITKTICEKNNKGTYIIKSHKTNLKYILKIRHKSHENSFEKNICSILKLHQHKNVIQFIDFYKNNEFYYFIYEYFEGTNLLNHIKKKSLTEQQIKHIIIQLSYAVNFLHSYDIIHCDLKLDNIIINSKNEIKIIDFDLSIISDNENGYIANNIFGTMQYIAPESYDLCIYSKKTDIWQIGIILYILICNEFPHHAELLVVNSYSNLCRQNLFKHIDLSIPYNIIMKNKYDESLYKLLSHMIVFDDVNRITIPEILNSEWLYNLDK